jgi:hypothetical protein
MEKNSSYPTGIAGQVVTDPELQAAAEAELRCFLGLPRRREDVRELIVIDDLTVGLTSLHLRPDDIRGAG